MSETLLAIQFYPDGQTGPVHDFLEKLRKKYPKATAKIVIDLQVLAVEGTRSKRINVSSLGKGI